MMTKKFLDSEGLAHLWNLIKDFVNAMFTASNIVRVLGNTSVNKAKDADTVDGKHASAFSLTSHNHDGRYALADHTHANSGTSGASFGTLDIENRYIMLAEQEVPTYSCYRVRESLELTIDASDAYRHGHGVWHKIMFFNQTYDEHRIILIPRATRDDNPIEIILRSLSSMEVTIVFFEESLIVNMVPGTA